MNTSESFIAHLIELRTRLLHAIVALLLVFLCLFPWASRLYALLAQPLLAKLPKAKRNGKVVTKDLRVEVVPASEEVLVPAAA